MNEYGVIFIVIITPKNTKISIEFDKEKATHFFPQYWFIFFRIY